MSLPNYYNKDLYKVLNLTYTATKEEIKSAYRKLVRIYHPDVSPESADVNKFKEIKEAYDVLIDDIARQKYDVLYGFFREKIGKEVNKNTNKYEEYMKSAQAKANKPQSFSKSFNDALDGLFNNTYTTKKNVKKSPAVNGSDISTEVNVSCFEAINGTNRKVNILHTEPCPNCGGRIFINGTKCSMCSGSGIVSLQKKINVKIPQGVKQGSKIRIKNEGNKGLNGGKNGDLYLIVNIEKNPYFDIEGINVLCNLPITPFEAVLGCEVSIPALDGNLSVKIPPMTSSGQKLKLDGAGVYNKSKTKKGDMIITVYIKLPKNYSAKELELYNQLKNLSSDDIRKDMKNAKNSVN